MRVVRWLLRRGKSLAQAADRIGLRPTTVRRWLARRPGSRAPCVHRGRPPVMIAHPVRQGAIAALDDGEVRGVGSLRRRLPGVGRNATADLVRRHRFLRCKRRRRRLCRLEWHVPCAVWAIDGTWLPSALANGARQALTVVDLGRRKVLVVHPVAAECAAAVIACLQDLVRCHGPPLVIKCDNGAGFIAESVRAFCGHHRVVLLHSPARCPSYNGACEAHNRWSKVRIARAAAAAGRRVPTQQDLAAACTATERCSALPDGLRRCFRDCFDRELRAQLAARGLADLSAAGHAARRSLERVAARRALEQCHILTIRGRDLRWR